MFIDFNLLSWKWLQSSFWILKSKLVIVSTIMFHYLPKVGLKKLYVLAYLGCTRDAGTSHYLNILKVLLKIIKIIGKTIWCFYCFIYLTTYLLSELSKPYLVDYFKDSLLIFHIKLHNIWTLYINSVLSFCKIAALPTWNNS